MWPRAAYRVHHGDSISSQTRDHLQQLERLVLRKPFGLYELHEMLQRVAETAGQHTWRGRDRASPVARAQRWTPPDLHGGHPPPGTGSTPDRRPIAATPRSARTTRLLTQRRGHVRQPTWRPVCQCSRRRRHRVRVLRAPSVGGWCRGFHRSPHTGRETQRDRRHACSGNEQGDAERG